MNKKMITIGENAFEFSRMITTSKGLCIVTQRVTQVNGRTTMKMRKTFIR